MTYYKAIKDVYFYVRKGHYLEYSGFVPPEALLTLKEYQKLVGSDEAVPSSKFIKVELKPRQTYTFFGFRFSYDDADLYSNGNVEVR